MFEKHQELQHIQFILGKRGPAVVYRAKKFPMPSQEAAALKHALFEILQNITLDDIHIT